MKIKLEKRISGTFFLSLKPDSEEDELQLQSILIKQKREKVKVWISTEENKDKIEIMSIDLREEE